MSEVLITIRKETFIDWNSPANAQSDFNGRFAGAFLGNEWRSDMSFYVPQDDRTFPAHSLIVGAASRFLERCCFGLDGDSTEAETIRLPDYCSADTFMIVLRFIYSGVTAPQLTEANAEAVLRIADYFNLHALMVQCGALIEPQLSTDNVCRLFDQVQHIDIGLNAACINFMLQNILTLLADGSVMRMSNEAVCKLLSMDTLGIDSETKLVAPAIAWADAECGTRAIEVTPVNRRLVLKPRLNIIRFAAMNYEEFMDSVRAFGEQFFTDSEIASTISCIHSKHRSIPMVQESPFSGDDRTPPNEIEHTKELLTPGKKVLMGFINFERPLKISRIKFRYLNANEMCVETLDKLTINGIVKATDPTTIWFKPAISPIDGRIVLCLRRLDGCAFQNYLNPYPGSDKVNESCVSSIFTI